ncbi:MAG: glycosyltransferase family 39 protein [Patescibacteria group bacterium]|nr:glycosyltransferase family 39 protein [Patescibacteria group bacterium]
MFEKYQNYIVAIILLIMLAISVGTALGDAAIMDEVAHIPSGYTYVKYGDYRLNPEHPPILKDMAGIPLQFLNLNFPVSDDLWTKNANDQWIAGWRFLYMPENNTETILFWSRFPIILLSLLLGFVIFKWARELFGVKAGLLALALYAFDPNILGHNHYVTTDLGIAAFSVFAFYFFTKYLKNPNWKMTFLAGVFLGFSQLAKFSAVLLFPIFGLTLLIYIFFREEKIKKSFLGSLKIKKFWLQKFCHYTVTFAVIMIVCFAMIWVVYEANTYKMPTEKIHQLIDTQLYGGSKNVASAPLHKMADRAVLRPLAQYFIGFFMVFGRVAGGNTTYFFGQVTNQSFREYFPLVFLIKEPIPTLILLFSTLAIAAYFILRNNLADFPKNIWKNIKGYFDRHITETAMLLFIALYAYVSITGNLNIGFRHLFPILPFMYILISKEIVFLWTRLRGNTRKIYSAVIAVLLFWLIAETAFAYPYYLAYFNETIGGSKNGYKYVTDSNVDWGQDLKRLQKFVDENNIDKIRVDYFGGGDVIHYLGDKAVIWHSDYAQETGWYAISATFLQNSLYYKITEGRPDYQWLREREPYAQIGGSILVYKIE